MYLQQKNKQIKPSLHCSSVLVDFNFLVFFQ
uniref:Uncharacterized protein n=1 Tax=Anguilla anguilla TaxID=7936 RepID=A0A0E9R846_ANGAN